MRDSKARGLEDLLQLIGAHIGAMHLELIGLQQLGHRRVLPEIASPWMLNKHTAPTFELFLDLLDAEISLSLGNTFILELLNQREASSVETIPTAPMFALRTTHEELGLLLFQLLIDLSLYCSLQQIRALFDVIG